MFLLSFLFVLFLLLKRGTNPTIFQKLDTSSSDCPLIKPTTSQICCRSLKGPDKKEKSQNQDIASWVRTAILVWKRFWVFVTNENTTIIATLASRVLFHQETYLNEACEFFNPQVIRSYLLSTIQQRSDKACVQRVQTILPPYLFW